MNNLIDAIKSSAVDKAINLPNSITRRYRFSEDFIGFSGHFPGYPILPAVAQLIIAQSLIEEQKGFELEMISVQNAKFLHEIKPGEELEITCMDFIVKEEPGSRVQIRSGDKIKASFILSFQLKGEKSA
jgi:3-hydroxyacyl-[acyl-carrier-protein] dehydratase